jgi:hypothetical protein
MRLLITSGICMCLMGCLGADDDAGSNTATEVKVDPTADAFASITPAPVAVAISGTQVRAFSAQLDEEPAEVTNVGSVFDPAKAHALEAFRARVGGLR